MANIGNNNTKLARRKRRPKGMTRLKSIIEAKEELTFAFLKKQTNKQTIDFTNSIEGYVLVTSISRRGLALQTRPVLNHGRSKTSRKGLGITDVFFFKIKIGHFYPQTANQITKLNSAIVTGHNDDVLATSIKVKSNSKSDTDDCHTGGRNGDHH
jgi:hypothetical protein